MINVLYISPEVEVIEKAIYDQICQTSLESGFEDINE